ncbi:MAG TPA: AbrB family transcriptional regulator [Rubrobacter sp.]|nr:AbrB family transcriptional regulator [Rubrobacter sp.]
MTARRSQATRVGWAVLVVGASLAGLLAQGIGLPAGWLVGPMLVAIAVALVWEGHPTMPRWGRTTSLAVVGGVLASAFKPSVLPLIARHWLPVVLVICATLILSLGTGLLLSVFARLDRKTAALGALPGAASGMLAMSGPLGADPRLVALMQYTRVVVVVVSATLVSRFGLVPGTTSRPQTLDQSLQTTSQGANLLVHGTIPTYALTALIAALGAWAGTRLRLPAGALVGPLLIGVALEELGVLHLLWPPGVPEAAYLVIGLWVGLLFDGASVKRAGRLFPLVLASAVGLVVVCTALAWVLSALTGIDGMTAYLATTPGGIDSVAIVALGSGADAPLVLAVQMLRLLAVVLAGSLLGRWLAASG